MQDACARFIMTCHTPGMAAENHRGHNSPFDPFVRFAGHLAWSLAWARRDDVVWRFAREQAAIYFRWCMEDFDECLTACLSSNPHLADTYLENYEETRS